MVSVDLAPLDGALRARLTEPAWRAIWDARVEAHDWSRSLPRALAPLPDDVRRDSAEHDAEDPAHERVHAATEVACGAAVGVDVVTSSHRPTAPTTGLVATVGLLGTAAAQVVRPVAPVATLGDRSPEHTHTVGPAGPAARTLAVGDGVEISAYDPRQLTRELARLLPATTEPSDGLDLPAHERVVTLPAELAATATKALREDNAATARTACQLAGLDEVPALLEALTELRGTASLSFRSPRVRRQQRLLACHLGWVELTPTTRGTTLHLLTHTELVGSWVSALSFAINERTGVAS